MKPQLSRDEVLLIVQQRATTLLMLPADRVQPDSRLIEDLQADSLFVTQLVFSLEDEFDIEAEEVDSEHFLTINSTTDYVMEQLKRK